MAKIKFISWLFHQSIQIIMHFLALPLSSFIRIFQVWKQYSRSHAAKNKAFSSPWQPKMLLELVANSYKVNLNKPYHVIMDKVSQVNIDRMVVLNAIEN